MLEAVREIWFGEGTTFIRVCYGNIYIDGEGGQLGDRGTVDRHGIVTVKGEGETCVVKVQGRLDKSPGESVDIEIDQSRRRDVANQHTAQHLLSAVFQRELQARMVGFQMGETYSTIDLDVPGLTDEMASLVETLANEYVREDRPVTVELESAAQALKLDLRKAVSDKVIDSGRPVRIVTIEGLDRSACGGFHVNSTGELRVIKITKREKVKGDLTRVYFLAGDRALEDYSQKHFILVRAARSLSCNYLDLPGRVDSLLEELKESKTVSRKLSQRLAETIASNFNGAGQRLLFLEDEEEVVSIVPKFIELKNYISLGKAGEKVFLACKGYDCRAVAKALQSKIELRGGAGKERGQFVFTGEATSLRETIEEIIEGGVLDREDGEKRES